jgi:hypothetical protein
MIQAATKRARYDQFGIYLGTLPVMEDNGPIGRSREIAGRVTRAVGDASQGISGRGVADKVDEFTNVYSEVLVGVHGDLQSVKVEHEELLRRVEIAERRIENLLSHETASDIDAMESEIHRLRWTVLILGLISVATAVVAGVAVWLTL